jgi:hypothetical protein
VGNDGGPQIAFAEVILGRYLAIVGPVGSSRQVIPRYRTSRRNSHAGTASANDEQESAYTGARLLPSDLHVVGLNRFRPVYVGNFNLEEKPALRYFHF